MCSQVIMWPLHQSCSSKGKITRALLCLMRQNGHCLTLSRAVKQHAYVSVEFAILQSQGGVKCFCDLQRSSGCWAKLFKVRVDAESKKSLCRVYDVDENQTKFQSKVLVLKNLEDACFWIIECWNSCNASLLYCNTQLPSSTNTHSSLNVLQKWNS